MKSRIGTINRKPIVQGDENLVTPNEIHISELEGRGGGGGGQSDIPVEYYKVVAPEGENLDRVRNELFSLIVSIVGDFGVSSLHILVKGTSSTTAHRLFTGLPLITATITENTSIHAYSIRAFQTITKILTKDGIIKEIPSFNNIFDALDSIDSIGPDISLQLKQFLVPITAEEFYNLDDLS